MFNNVADIPGQYPYFRSRNNLMDDRETDNFSSEQSQS
jgi:hypothetical protein